MEPYAASTPDTIQGALRRQNTTYAWSPRLEKPKNDTNGALPRRMANVYLANEPHGRNALDHGQKAENGDSSGDFVGDGVGDLY